MARSEQEPAPRRRAATQGTWRNHLAGRVDPLTSAILVFPLFAIYQLGILASRGQNGVDFVTSALVELAESDLENYLGVLTAMLVIYAAILVILRRRGSFTPRAFVPVLAESGFYAITMGTLILFVMRRFLHVDPQLAISSGVGAMDVLVISAGAGLHEELIFRAIGMGGLVWLSSPLLGQARAWVVALAISSVLFSIAHHVGPLGEPFTFGAFVYRALAGAFFALVYQIRGFAVAAWTHAIYDVYVLSFTL